MSYIQYTNREYLSTLTWKQNKCKFKNIWRACTYVGHYNLFEDTVHPTNEHHSNLTQRFGNTDRMARELYNFEYRTSKYRYVWRVYNCKYLPRDVHISIIATRARCRWSHNSAIKTNTSVTLTTCDVIKNETTRDFAKFNRFELFSGVVNHMARTPSLTGHGVE